MKLIRPIGGTLLKGLIVLLPIAVLLSAAYWLANALDSSLGRLVRLFLPAHLYFPGMGIAAGLIFIYLVGLLMKSQAAQTLFGRWQNMLQKVPLVKTLYGAAQDIIGFFSADKKQKFDQVVIVSLKESGVRLVGFVTRRDISSLPLGAGSTGDVAVYLPMSYQIGGYMVLVPRSSAEPIEMSVEDASRLVFTAGMSAGKSFFQNTNTKIIEELSHAWNQK